MVMKLSLKDKGDLQGQRQGAQSKISVQKKKKVKGIGPVLGRWCARPRQKAYGRLEWVLSQMSQDGEDTARLEIRHIARCLCIF